MNAASVRSWLPPALALAWIVLVRVPLVMNAEAHLDSDLAVDGLTLADAARGRWRWHYPGTPAIGTPPVLASLPMALIWGANPVTLVAGGVVLYGAAMAAIYLLNRRVYGPAVAAWGLVPMAFGSTGLIWLSGRITGGHLLVVAWAAVALALLHRAVSRGAIGPAFALGLWCGLGLYVDRMFLLVLVAIVLGGVTAAGLTRIGAREYDAGLAFVVGTIVGHVPRWVGTWADPHDAYGEPFVSIFRPIGENPAVFGVAWEQAGALLTEHARILFAECLPRLVAGHRLPTLAADPSPGGVADPSAGTWTAAACWTALGLVLFAAALAAVARRARRGDDPPGRRAVSRALVLLALFVVAGFLLNRNIFNADNYRYLVLLLIPWSVGFGLVMDGPARRARWSRSVATGLTALVALMATADALVWYRGLGWVEGVRPVARPPRDLVVEWLKARPGVQEIHGRYWVVYRAAFLVGRPMRAVPWSDEPQRFEPPGPWRPGDGEAVALLTGGYRLNAAQVEEIRQRTDGVLARWPGAQIFRWR
jgi:hypothetical protein